MQYEFHINQKNALELSKETGIKIDLKDLAILNYINHFTFSGQGQRLPIGNRDYFFINYAEILENLPLLRIKSLKTIEEKINKLVDAQVFVKVFVNCDEVLLYFGEKWGFLSGKPNLIYI